MKNISASIFNISLFVCLSILSVNGVFAQENGIYEVTSSEEFSSKVKIKKYKDKNRGKFYNLIQKIYPTAYISNKKINNIYGNGDIIKVNFGDTKSFSLLDEKKFNKAQLIITTLNKVTDLNNTLDLTVAEKYSNIKYVFVRCNFKCTKKQIRNFIKTDSNSKIRIFFRIESSS